MKQNAIASKGKAFKLITQKDIILSVDKAESEVVCTALKFKAIDEGIVLDQMAVYKPTDFNKFN